MKPFLARLVLALGLLAPLAALATPTCPQTTEAPLSEVPAALKPGAWVASDAFDTVGQPENPLSTFHPAFKDQLTVAKEALEIRGFIESEDPGARVAVVLLKRVQEGFCVLNTWISSPSEHFGRLVLVSMWRSKDSQCGMFLIEASNPRSGEEHPNVRALVLGTHGQHVWKAFEANSTGLAFDPQPGTLALLGAGEPLLLDAAGQFSPRPVPKGTPAAAQGTPTCPKTGNKPMGSLESDPLGEDSSLSPGQWIPSDAASQLYSFWDKDSRGQVAFRKLLTVGGKEVEAVGLTGNDAVVAFLAPAPKGFCVLNSRYWPFGGNGVSFQQAWWTSKNRKLTVLLLEVTAEFHHGADADDPRAQDAHLALALDGQRVRLASASEEASARAAQKPR
ncbi:hypothetical protein [Hyalangium versicolor]|uniref:hypothetical protein n=1 Tax=Hyalangium versicolor TaxID=2861190 RepID=UPI001CCF7CC5|nr:hypothetical protein [Hyalangium versicolor]